MINKKGFIFICFVLLVYVVWVPGPSFAREEEEVEDVADISLEDLLNVEITTAVKKGGKEGSKIPSLTGKPAKISREKNNKTATKNGITSKKTTPKKPPPKKKKKKSS